MDVCRALVLNAPNKPPTRATVEHWTLRLTNFRTKQHSIHSPSLEWVCEGEYCLNLRKWLKHLCPKILCTVTGYTSSLRRIRPRRGRDMDHWLRQFSNIMTFMTEDSICCRISGCNSRMLKKWVRWEGDRGRPLFLLSFLKRKVRMWSRVVQHPVHTIASASVCKWEVV